MAYLPHKLGPFEPLHRLGAGGMAETFVAVRRGPAGFEQRVCIKRILPAYVGDRSFVESFLAEARTSAALRHANIVQVLDFGVADEDGSYYLALELIDGLDLRALAEQGATFDPALVTLIASDLAAGLEHAHAPDDQRAKVVHRDISPSNVLVSRAGEIKLTDFGIARVMGSAQRTATGVIKGKVPYMPPEYIESGRFDERGDLFALGVLLFELLHGERPFEGESDLDTLRRIVAGERRRFTAKAPPALTAVIERLLQRRPEDRFQSARALLDALPSVPMNLTRKRLADLVRARTSSTPRQAPASLAVNPIARTVPARTPAVQASQPYAPAPLAPVAQPAALRPSGPPRAPVLEPTRTSYPVTSPAPSLRPSRFAVLMLAGSAALLFAVALAALLRLESGAAGAAAVPAAPPVAPPVPPPANALAAPARDDPFARDDHGEPEADLPEEPTPGETDHAEAEVVTALPSPPPSFPLGRLARRESPTSGAKAAHRPGRRTRPHAPEAAPAPSAPASAPAELRVVVYPFGEVWIDDRYVGHSPLSVKLAAGSHEVAVGEGRARASAAPFRWALVNTRN